MKRVFGVAAVGLAAGIWAGLRFHPSSASVVSPFEIGLLIVISGTLVLGLWAWTRAPRESGDAGVMPMIVLGLVLQIGILLPHVVWPDAKNPRMAGLLASTVASMLLLAVQIRRHRRRAAHRV